jgi:hypothetical protein
MDNRPWLFCKELNSDEANFVPVNRQGIFSCGKLLNNLSGAEA